MKQREFRPCVNCGGGMAKEGVHFYRVTVEQMVLDMGAIQRAHGLEMAMGAAAPLSQHMGPDEDLAKGLGPHTFLVCGQCGMREPVRVHELLEKAAEKEDVA